MEYSPGQRNVVSGLYFVFPGRKSQRGEEYIDINGKDPETQNPISYFLYDIFLDKEWNLIYTN